MPVDPPPAPHGGEPSKPSQGSKARLFLGWVVAVLAADFATKRLVEARMHLYEQIDVLGSFVRLTYIHNPGAAFGIHLGPYSRPIFLVLSVIVLAALGGMIRFTPAGDRLRIIAIALVTGGALGNLIDRIKSARGVVDFVDVGIGTWRWPIFNVADVALTVGAIVLAASLWHEERQLRRRVKSG